MYTTAIELSTLSLLSFFVFLFDNAIIRVAQVNSLFC